MKKANWQALLSVAVLSFPLGREIQLPREILKHDERVAELQKSAAERPEELSLQLEDRKHERHFGES